ncbi:MAG: response regulator [Bacteroidetes bacterium]|nr:response regulator [Bacteroidota bacterium]MCW5895957.1 response regulator [Bacteroidota bacterium]
MDDIRILLIEDDIVDRLAFKRHIERENIPFRFDIADSFARALPLLRAQRFDAVISDYHLGDGTALDVCEQAKSIPLIIITGAGNEEIAVRAMKAGAYDYLIKDPERNYLNMLPLTVQKAVDSNRAKKQRDMLLHAIMHTNDTVFVTDVTGTIQFANKAFCESYGYTEEEVVGLHERAVCDEHSDGETIHRRKNGTEFYVSLSRSIVRDEHDAVTAIVTVGRDITERKRSEEALRASEEQYRDFFNDDLAGAFTSAPNGRLLSCNPSFARIFGFDSVEEALAFNLIGLYPKSRQFAEVRDLLRVNLKLEHQELQLRRRDGSQVFVIQNVIGKYDAAGELTEIKGYVFDNTRHKLLEEQLRQAQKMESIGTLAGGIAHDFNNILAIIMGHAHILLKGDPELIRKANSVDTINRAVQRGTKLVKQILTFARRNETVFEPVDLNHVIQELQKMLSETFPKIIDFRLQLDPALPATIADSNQVHQALLNLCVNARDAMPNGGTLGIETELIRGLFLRERYPEAHEHMYAGIRVSDSGTGMPPEVLNRMFEPFFTTKEIGKGTGLGLAVVYGVTRSHSGFVDVTSEPGKGTTFTLYFPVRREDVEHEAKAEQMQADQSSGGETILVVEDEQLLLDLVKGLLESKGYKVLSAVDGLEAINIYSSKKDEIDLVLTDLGLPKIDGWEAFQRMKEINPNVKVVFASGYIDTTLRSNLLRAGAKDLVQKPYLPDEILNRVRELVSREAESICN